MIYLLRSLANVSEWSKGVRPSPPARTLLWKICWVLSVYHFLPPKKVMIYLLRSLANVSEWSKGVWPSPLARTLLLKICWVLSVYHSLPPQTGMIYLLSSLANVCERSQGVRWSHLLRSPPSLKAGLLGDIVKDQLCWKGLSFDVIWRSFDHKMERSSSRKGYPKALLNWKFNNWSNHCFTFLCLIKGEIDWYGSLLCRNTCIFLNHLFTFDKRRWDIIIYIYIYFF